MPETSCISAFQQPGSERRMDFHRRVDNRPTDLVPVFAYCLNFSVSSVVNPILSRTAYTAFCCDS